MTTSNIILGSLMVFFIICAIVFGILYAFTAPQSEILVNDEPRLYAFSQFYGNQIINDGTSAISCQNGGKVVIVDAQYMVYDAYRQCYQASELAFQPPVTTDDESKSNPNKSCGPYWTGQSGKITASGSTGEDVNGVPTAATICAFDVDGGGGATEGRTCWGGSSQCSWSNVTQYIADKCDGKASCTVIVDNSLGPAPCNLLMEVTDPNVDFASFPESEKIVNSTQPGNEPGGQRGYSVSGTYLCQV